MAQAQSTLLALVGETPEAVTSSGPGDAAAPLTDPSPAEETSSEGTERDAAGAMPGAIPGLVETVAGAPILAGGLGEQEGHREAAADAGGGAASEPVLSSVAAATAPAGGAQGSPAAAGMAQDRSGTGTAALPALLNGGTTVDPSFPHGSAAPEAASAAAPSGSTSKRPGLAAREAPDGPATQAAAPAAEQSRIVPEDASLRVGVPVDPAPLRAEDRAPESAWSTPTAPVGAPALQAGPGDVSAPSAGAGPTVANVPLGAVAVEIGLKTMAGVNQFDIRLNPEELGGVQVRLAIEGGEVKASLIVDRVETLSLLQREAKTLERAFEQAGLKPSEGGIDLTLRDPQSQGRGQGHHDERALRRGAPSDRRAGDASLDETPPPTRMLWRAAGALDLRI